MPLPPPLPAWLEEISNHLLSTTELVNNFNQEDVNSTMSGSPKGLYALDRESWITARCKLVAITFLSPSDFVCNRMWRLVVPISIVVAAVLPGGNPIAVSSLRPFSYHPTISSNRSGSGAQRDSAAGRLPPLSVSAPFTAVRFD